MVKESMALGDFLEVCFTFVGFSEDEFLLGAVLALEGAGLLVDLAGVDFLLDALMLVDLVCEEFLFGLTSASLGEDLDLEFVVFLVADFLAVDLVSDM